MRPVFTLCLFNSGWHLQMGVHREHRAQWCQTSDFCHCVPLPLCTPQLRPAVGTYLPSKFKRFGSSEPHHDFIQCFLPLLKIVSVYSYALTLLHSQQVFCRGLMVNTVRGFPSSAAMFLGYELSLKAMKRWQTETNP